MTVEKIVVDGEEVWANPYYRSEPVPEGFDPAWTGEPPYNGKLVKATPAWRIACTLGKIRGNLDAEQTYVRDVTRFDDGRVMADVLIKGEWGRYVCTADEIEARKGGRKVDTALEVVA